VEADTVLSFYMAVQRITEMVGHLNSASTRLSHQGTMMGKQMVRPDIARCGGKNADLTSGKRSFSPHDGVRAAQSLIIVSSIFSTLDTAPYRLNFKLFRWPWDMMYRFFCALLQAAGLFYIDSISNAWAGNQRVQRSLLNRI
jgi:hypothetical protein